jgi:hypothetical protein
VGESAEDLFPADPVVGEVDRIGWPGVVLGRGELSEGAVQTILFGCKTGIEPVLPVSPGRVAGNVWCRRDRCGAGGPSGSSAACGRIELGHELAVGGAGGIEVLAAVFELEAQVGRVLFEMGDFLVERVDVGGGAES